MDHLLSREHGASASNPTQTGCGHHHDSAVQVREHQRTLPSCICSEKRKGSSALADCKPVSREDRMSTRWMPWRCVPRKDGAPLRYALGSRLQALIQRSPNEATHPFEGTGHCPGGHPAN
jgi:hypothetical protein